MSETSQSLLDGIAIDVDRAKCAGEGVQSQVLKPIGVAFSTNVSNAAGLLLMPEKTANVLAVLIAIVTTALTKSETVRTVVSDTLSGAPLDEKALQQALSTGDRQSIADATFAILNDIKPKNLVKALDELDFARPWILSQLSAATSGAWTAFECLATDAWVAAVNSRPKVLGQRAIEAEATGDESDAFSKKSVQFWQLARYDFDVHNQMGTLLKRKFDLTSLENIQKAHHGIFKPSVPNDIFKNDDLRLLAASRHVIVHNAGIVDEDFIEDTKGLNVSYPQGQQLPLNGALVSRLANAAIDSGCKLLEFVDGWLVTNPG